MDPVELAPGCWSDGRLVGSTATLLIDPTPDSVSPDSVASGLPGYVLFTSAGTVVELPSVTPATVFVHANAADAAAAAFGSVPIRGLHTAGVVDLGGIVAEITHLGPGRSGSDLVVSARVVDRRGVPVRTVPPVVYVGDLLDPGEHAVSAPVDGGSEQMWAASLDLLGGLLGPTGKVARRSGVPGTYDEVESQRGMRLERGGLIRMPESAKRLPML
ncbi:MAG TPA: hypothetical protein VIM10_18920 [Actinopolymorphaceae bacterium]|jgi:hypothetical protein